MTNMLDPGSELYSACDVAEQFVCLAANGTINDTLVDELNRQIYSKPLVKLATEAEMTPWGFLDFVAEQVAADAFNEIMLGSISPQVFGLLTTLNQQRDDEAKREEAMTQLSRDLELALAPA